MEESITKNILMKASLRKLQKEAQEFADSHKNALQTDPELREEFLETCTAVGLDPLWSSQSVWTTILGVGEFYFQLAVHAVELVKSGADYHGGVMRVGILWKQLKESKQGYLKKSNLSGNDVIQAFASMEVIGNQTCGVIGNDDPKYLEWCMVFCTAEELEVDSKMVIQTVSRSGKACFSLADLEKLLEWTFLRIASAVDKLICQGIIWLDLNSHPGAKSVNEIVSLYWLPGLFFNEL